MRLRFRFAKEEEGNAILSEWGDFQAYRKVLGVLGLCYAPASDIDEVYSTFKEYTSQYASAKAMRCFVFEPSEDQVARDSKSREHLIMFPPGERQALEYHVTTMMHDFCAHLLMAFEEYVLVAENMGSSLTSPLDDIASQQKQNDLTLQKKQQLGRVQKSIGDHCLLAGSPEDAHDHYMTATDLARQSGDIIWHAGAIEGLVASLVVQHENRLIDIDEEGEEPVTRQHSMDDESLTSLRIMYYEAISLYLRKNATVLAQEATLKLANIISTYGRQPMNEVLELTSNAIERLSDSTILNEEKMLIMLEISRVMHDVGCERKAALALWSAVMFAELFDSSVTRHTLKGWGESGPPIALRLCLELERMCALSSNRPESSETTPSTSSDAADNGHSDNATTPPRRDCRHPIWATLHRGVLAKTLEWSARGGDAVHAWSASSKLLMHRHEAISLRTQHLLSNALQACARHISFGAVDVEPLLPAPRLVAVVEQPSYLNPIPWHKLIGDNDPAAGHGGNLFLYTPYERMRRSETMKSSTETGSTATTPPAASPWVCGDERAILVELENPYLFDIELSNVQLSTSGVVFEAQPQSFLLRRQSHVTLTLRGTTNASGKLKLDGLTMTAYGVTWFTAWSTPLRGSSASTRVEKDNALVIPVIRKLPFLHRTSSDAEGSIAVSQLEGECAELSVEVMNSGAVPVTEIDIGIEQKKTTMSSHGHSTIQVHVDDFKRRLPISPGTSVVLTFSITARLASGDTNTRDLAGHSGANIEEKTIFIQYGGSFGGVHTSMQRPAATAANGSGDTVSDISSMRHGRRLAIPLSLETRPGPRLRDVKVHTFGIWDRLGHGRLLAMDIFNPTTEDVELKAISSGGERQSVVNVHIGSMCGRNVTIPLDGDGALDGNSGIGQHSTQAHAGSENGNHVNALDSNVSLTWTSKSKLVGDLSSALNQVLTSRAAVCRPRSLFIVGCFFASSEVQTAGGPILEDDGKCCAHLTGATQTMSCTRMVPTKVAFCMRSGLPIDIDIDLEFTVDVCGRSTNTTRAGAESVVPAGNWARRTVQIPASPSSLTIPVAFLPTGVGVSRILPVVHGCDMDTSISFPGIDTNGPEEGGNSIKPAHLVLPIDIHVV